jgi:hypothetical protein
MSKWWSVCEECGLGLPPDEPRVDIKDCKHPSWVLFKEEENE